MADPASIEARQVFNRDFGSEKLRRQGVATPIWTYPPYRGGLF
jgi:hypothetical protein